MSTNSIGFVRTAHGVKLVGLVGAKFSVYLTFDEIARLNSFVDSGSRASSGKLRQGFERALRATETEDLERELERRAEAGA